MCLSLFSFSSHSLFMSISHSLFTCLSLSLSLFMSLFFHLALSSHVSVWCVYTLSLFSCLSFFIWLSLHMSLCGVCTFKRSPCVPTMSTCMKHVDVVPIHTGRFECTRGERFERTHGPSLLPRPTHTDKNNHTHNTSVKTKTRLIAVTLITLSPHEVQAMPLAENRKTHNSQFWLCNEQHWLQSNMTAVHPRVFEILTTLTFGALRKNHIVSPTFEDITKKHEKNNETSSSTCGQQCIMKCQEHNRSKKKDVA